MEMTSTSKQTQDFEIHHGHHDEHEYRNDSKPTKKHELQHGEDYDIEANAKLNTTMRAKQSKAKQKQRSWKLQHPKHHQTPSSNHLVKPRH
jgi:hypothetical protein